MVLIYIFAAVGVLAIIFVIIAAFGKREPNIHNSSPNAAQTRLHVAHENADLVRQCFLQGNSPSRLTKNQLLLRLQEVVGKDAEVTLKQLRSLGLIEKHTDVLGTMYYWPSDVFMYKLPILPGKNTVDHPVLLIDRRIAMEASTFRLAIYFIFCRETGKAESLSEGQFYAKLSQLERGDGSDEMVQAWIASDMISVEDVKGDRYFSVGPIYDLSCLEEDSSLSPYSTSG